MVLCYVDILITLLLPYLLLPYLWCLIVSSYTWKNHVNELCLKLSKPVGIFSKLWYYVNVDTLITLLLPYLLLPYLWYSS